MKPAGASMTQEEYLLLNELISGQFGISFPEHKREVLESRLRPRLRALSLDRYWDYYLQLQCDTAGERERLAELVTNNETFFFRETHPIESFFEEAVPRPGALRVLSAGCSSGEEPYTLGIYARQNAVRLGGAGVAVDAFDLDASRVEAARRAEYGRSSLRSASPEQVERYFTAAGPERWALKVPFRERVRFAWGNILDLETFRSAAPYDAVFCRNVLIYFSEAAVRRAVKNFAEVLRPGGLLFLGASESIIGLSDRFQTVRLSRSIAYRRVEP
ncbi:MAG TPA: protein-glutamate O-methyltransferase CheR [Thermoanaerobaculia bacterium]|nr:protein-glutamate O-methyltransferase CheR [Thermoanaerobaculia bacterium]